jgi:hypothetical protein
MRRLVSLAIVLHLVALLTAVAMPPYFRGAPAAVVTWIYHHVTRPYLEFVALTNDYRFYAPEIAIYTQAWFRISNADGTVRWTQFARRDEFSLHMHYQRQLGIPLMMQSALRASASKPGAPEITATGRVLFASFVRYAARREQARGTTPMEIQLYFVAHRVRQPAEIQRGWSPTDPRLYLPRYLGTYDTNGESRIASRNAQYPTIPMSLFVTTMLGEDIGPARVRDETTLPDPARDLLVRHPELVERSGDEDLRNRIRSIVAADDRPPSDPAIEW